ncbi:MAG TPA: flagellar hook-associated protein FlgK [Fibrobacteria bacterium]|nr:flagellar hook-associated protein FlgK [Fibrobacteria bacterium]
MGLMDALNIGMRGLHAAQSSIDVTGQNISNANTEGYSRKRVNQSADVVRDDMYGEKGLGVQVTDIQRIRDTFLDRQTWEQLGEKGYTTQLDTAYTRIENILNEPTENGLAAQMNAFWASWQDLANNPGDLSAREAVKSSASTMLDTFHAVFKQIEDFGKSMNNPLDQSVKTVNDLTGQIYLLNEKIAGAEARPGENANDSRDQRDLLVRRLSQLIDVQTIEDANGRCIITSGGNLVVGPSEALKLETYGANRTLPDGTETSELLLRFSGSYRSFEPRSGELKGIIDSRRNVLANYMQDLNALAATMVKEVNAVHVSGYNLNKASGTFFFDPTKTKAGDISLSDTILAGAQNIAAAAGGKIIDVAAFLPAGGIPALASPVLDLKATNPSYRDLVLDSVKVTMADGSVLAEGSGKDYVVDYENGTITFVNYARYAAGDAATVKISYNTTGFSGNGNGQNALNIAGLRLKPSMIKDNDGNYTQSINSFYSATIGKLGIEKNQNASRKETKEFLIGQMDAEQASISGVSLDEEMTNMIKYENSYKASARYISTISQMMDVLMALGQ